MGTAAPNAARRRVPLYVRIVIAVAVGALAGTLLRERAAPLQEVGLLVVRMLKALATPLILLAVLDAFLRTRIPAKRGAALVGLSAINAVAAIAIGLGVSHLTGAGNAYRGRMSELVAATTAGTHHAPAAHHGPGEAPTVDFLTNLARYVPDNVVDPFAKNNVITVVLLAVLLGAALRALRNRVPAEHESAPYRDPAASGVVDSGEHAGGEGHGHGADLHTLRAGLDALANGIHALFAALAQVLEWIIALVPLAVGAIVCALVGKTGFGVFRVLLPFLGTALLGLALHAFGYYAILLAVAARRSPRAFFAGASDAIVTAMSCGSSLATLPVTLRCMKKLGISDGSARLAACVGTNLNHDGIILYEATAAIFMTQAFGHSLTLGQQVGVALASVMAGVGIAGVPEAGLITLPLVLGAAGMPAETTALVVPLVLPVDWIIGRARATTNVLSDMTVAAVLDRVAPDPEANAAPTAPTSAAA